MNSQNIVLWTFLGSTILAGIFFTLPKSTTAKKEFPTLSFQFSADTAEVIKLNQQAKDEIEAGNLESSLKYASEALEMAESKEYGRGFIDASLNIGLVYRLRREYPKALDHYLKAIQKTEGMNSAPLSLKVYRETSALYQDWNVSEKAIENLQKAYEISKNINDEERIKSLQSLAFAYQKNNDAENTIKYFQELADHFKAQQNYSAQASALIKIADVHIKQRNFNDALNINLEVLEIRKQSGDKQGEANQLNEIGFIYKQMNRNADAIKYFQKALALNRELGKDEMQNTTLLTNIAVINQRDRKFDEAIKSYREVLKISESQGTPQDVARANTYLASTYLGLNDFKSAKKYTQDAIRSAKKANDLNTLEKSYQRLSEIHEKSGNVSKALDTYKEYLALKEEALAEEKAKQEKLLANQLDAEKQEKRLKLLVVDQELKALALENLQVEAEKKQQQLTLLQQQQELQAAKLQAEQLERERVAQELKLTEQQLRAEKRSQEIAELQRQKELQELQLRQQELEEAEQQKALELLQSERTIQEQEAKLLNARLEEAEAERKQQELQRNFGLGIIGLFLVVLVLIIMGYVGKKRANQKLAIQNDEIRQQKEEIEQTATQLSEANEAIEHQRQELEFKNKRLTDSIIYAERIQNAILPTSYQINQVFDDHFTIFYPKDMVSGDFYWFTSINGKSFVATVDCTGHGVPGAFMSMIGNTLLNQIVKEKKIFEPNLILETLHYGVRESLKQRDSSNVDGMDIGLCCFEKWEDDIYSIKFSGAKCPLIYTQDGKLQFIRGDRKSIGGWQKEKNHTFTTHTIRVNKGDMIYLATDGISDAANKYRKRMGRKTLREILSANSHLPLDQQKKTLEEKLELHQRGADQRDDITFIGLRV